MSNNIIYIAVGPQCWGRGNTINKAVAEMRKNWSGRYSKKKVQLIQVTGDPMAHIDGMGGLVRNIHAKIERCSLIDYTSSEKPSEHVMRIASKRFHKEVN